jgi:hypothetical protein
MHYLINSMKNLINLIHIKMIKDIKSTNLHFDGYRLYSVCVYNIIMAVGNWKHAIYI